jgi:hypothetical protein
MPQPKRSGILSDRERRFIDTETQPPQFLFGDAIWFAEDLDTDEYRRPEELTDEDFDESEMKYRIRKKAHTDYLRKEIQDLRKDLERVRNFWLAIEDDPAKWNQAIAGNIEDDLEYFQTVAASLVEPQLDESLWGHVREKLDRPRFRFSELDHGAPDLEAALLYLLGDPGLIGILRYIKYNPSGPAGGQLPRKKKRGSKNGWRWYASRYLEGEFGLIEEVSEFSERKSYRITEDGERVTETINWLEYHEEVEEIAENEDIDECTAAKQILKQQLLDP